MAETKASTKQEKPVQEVTSSDARFSVVKPAPKENLAPDAGRSLIEVRGEPSEAAAPADKKEG